MNKKRFFSSPPHIITLFLDILLLVAVLFLMNHVRELLYSDVKINLTEVVTQNKDVISSKIMVEVNNLNQTAKQLSEWMDQKEVTGDNLQSNLDHYHTDNPDSLVFISSTDGTAYYMDGSTIDISGRGYFRLALDGITNISDRLVSRIDGTEVFIISAPMKRNGEVIATVHKVFTPDQMYNLCSISVFSAQGSMCIINSDGYILISSVNDAYSHESENYYRYLYAQGNQEASQILENDIKNNRSGLMQTTVNGNETFSAYTPIETIHDWYLISSIPTNAVSPNTKIVLNLFYMILLVIVFVFALSILFFLSFKNRQRVTLEKIAFIDKITGGDTYTKFLVDLQQSLQQNPEKQYYLLSFDIDNFKYINNYYGFDFGDQILKQVHDDVKKLLISGETVARISSDNFIALIENITPERLDAFIKTIQSGKDIILYCSAGLYPITDRNENYGLMIDKAGTAARTSKGNFRKEVVFYTEKLDQTIIRNEQTKRNVELALADDEMIPFFQPKVDINTKKLVGAEALVRWKTKEGKLISPFEFIPLCEKTGLIVELDMIVFEKTLRFIRKCLDDGVVCVPISVNFSRMHLPDKNFISNIQSKLEQYQIPPQLIEVELTESVIFDNYTMITDLVNQLHDSGLFISMDDFGSGYSSLNMLKDIPIDTIKIDREFLKETVNRDKQQIILSSISQMAERLHIKIVVEGVETIENVRLMKEIGCHVAQGYYFAKPMDSDSFEVIYRNGCLE